MPQANLANLDPIWTTQYVVRNGSLLIWDTLYGVNDKLEAQPQMCAGHEVSPDFKTWTFKLRDGLKFHDGTPVLARDVVASISRWMVRDAPMGVPIKKRTDALEAVDDRTFRFRLNQPYPKMLFALGKSSSPCLFIMPERIAQTDPFKQISEYVGSGPMKFKRDEWVPGQKQRSRNSTATCRAPNPRTGSPAASGCISTGSSGTSCRIPAPPRPPCRMARSTGGKPRCPTWYRC